MLSDSDFNNFSLNSLHITKIFYKQKLLAGQWLSVFTKIVAWTRPQALPPNQQSCNNLCHTIAQPVTIQSELCYVVFIIPSLSPTNWEGLNVTTLTFYIINNKLYLNLSTWNLISSLNMATCLSSKGNSACPDSSAIHLRAETASKCHVKCKNELMLIKKARV